MDEVLQDIDFVVAYLDDIFVFSILWDEPCAHLDAVFNRLRQFNVKLKLAKSHFGASSVRCLGHVVGNGELRPDPDNVSAILNLPEPKDVPTLRSVLGMAGYYRDYIPNFARETEPMARLLQKNTPWEWSPECTAAFNMLKQQITSDPVLRLPDPNLQFILTTDWSRLAIGAVLSQKDPHTGFDHPVAYKSRLLSSAEKNYAPTEGECLALIWAI
jgi:RNase H-like domain found in reverse transcriptase